MLELLDYWLAVLACWAIAVALILAFFAGANRRPKCDDDLTESEADEIAERLRAGERHIRVHEHDAQPERGSAAVKEIDAPALDGRRT